VQWPENPTVLVSTVKIGGPKPRNAGAFSKRPDIAELAVMRGWGGRIRTRVRRNQFALEHRFIIAVQNSLQCTLPEFTLSFTFRRYLVYGNRMAENGRYC
jgi:hypothetical protein